MFNIPYTLNNYIYTYIDTYLLFYVFSYRIILRKMCNTQLTFKYYNKGCLSPIYYLHLMLFYSLSIKTNYQTVMFATLSCRSLLLYQREFTKKKESIGRNTSDRGDEFLIC